MAKLELEYPFNRDWDKAYTINSSDRRKRVILLKKGKRSGLSYARYLMSVKEGRYLNPKEHVDHINEDCSDDRIENLQILTAEENNKKHREFHGKQSVYVELICPCCGDSFQRTESYVKSKLKTYENLFCSRLCSGSMNNNSVDKEKIRELRQQGYSSYKISAITGHSRNTVMKYWSG